jgi:DNA-3-methyladenine glycosylase I
MTRVVHPDGLARCPWPKLDPLYVRYHDEEWGVPEYDDRALYEKLVLDGFQAGLSWITILRKRENFRRAFDRFEPEKIARYTPRKIEKLMHDEGIVRNRMKIEGAVLSARAWLGVMEKEGGFSRLLWNFLDGKPKVNRFRSTRSRRKLHCRARSQKSSPAEASNSAGRPSSTPSCRQPAW